MHTEHKIILGNSQTMPELADGSVQLMVTSPPYPMIQMWDGLFAESRPKNCRRYGENWKQTDEEAV